MRTTLLAGAALLALSTMTTANAKPLTGVGITLGSLGNPYFVALAKGAGVAAKAINPNANVVDTSADYDLNKQFTQVDNFIASGVSLILINGVDPNAIRPPSSAPRPPAFPSSPSTSPPPAPTPPSRPTTSKPAASPANSSPRSSAAKATSPSRTALRSPPSSTASRAASRRSLRRPASRS